MTVEVQSWQGLTYLAGSNGAARGLIARGEWRRVVYNAYVPRGTADDITTRVAALHSVLPSDVAVSGRTALWLLGQDDLGDAVDITVPRGRHLLPKAGLRPRTAQLPDHELVMVDGLIATSAARAVVDIARREPLAEAVAVADAALRAGLASIEGVSACVEEAFGLRGVERARAAVPHLEPRSESRMESRVRIKLVLGGVPRPQAQVDVYDDDGHVARGDLGLDGVIWEYDGREQRLNKDSFVKDRRRHSRLAEVGYEIRRLTSADYYVRSTASLCAEACRALEMARGRDRSRLRSGPDTLRAPRERPLPTLADTRLSAAG